MKRGAVGYTSGESLSMLKKPPNLDLKSSEFTNKDQLISHDSRVGFYPLITDDRRKVNIQSDPNSMRSSSELPSQMPYLPMIDKNPAMQEYNLIPPEIHAQVAQESN